MAPNEVFVGMQEAQYEPPAEQVEALAKELWDERCREAAQGCPWSGLSRENRRNVEAEARFVLRRQHEREAGLLEALRSIERMNYIGTPARVCSLALAAHAKLDAPKVPSLLEAAKAMLGEMDSVQGLSLLPKIAALKAAVEREEKR